LQVDPFRIRDHVANFDAIVADILRRSEATRATSPMLADVAYGPGPGETFDLFFPPGGGTGRPVHMFIHGGYWRMFSKRDYSYVAATITRAGAIAAIVDYALMPAVRMHHIVDQVRRAKHWLLRHAADHGGDPARLTVSGHSAGAHLSTFLFNEPATPSGVRAAFLLGGIYDLAPLRNSFLQGEISLTDDEVARFSPLSHTHDRQTRVSLLVGADETPPFHAQAKAFGRRLTGQGLGVESSSLAAANHMSSVRDLGFKGTEAAARLTAVIAAAA
jgi:arylformamidase